MRRVSFICQRCRRRIISATEKMAIPGILKLAAGPEATLPGGARRGTPGSSCRRRRFRRFMDWCGLYSMRPMCPAHRRGRLGLLAGALLSIAAANAGASDLRVVDLDGRTLDPLAADANVRSTVFLFTTTDCPIQAWGVE